MKEKKLFYRKVDKNLYSVACDKPDDAPLMQGNLDAILCSSVDFMRDSGSFARVKFVNKDKFSAKEMELIANTAEGRGYINMGLEDECRLRTHTFKSESNSFSFINYKGTKYVFNDQIEMMYGFAKDIKHLIGEQNKEEEGTLRIKPVFEGRFDDLTKEIIKCLGIGTEQRIYRIGCPTDRKD